MIDHLRSFNDKYRAIIVWLFRILVGATFIFSGLAKSIDIWGVIYKLQEYLNVWHIGYTRSLLLTGGVLLSIFEFTVGITLFTGCLRRVSVWGASAIMAFMLPLTVYIAIVNPVSDCGCFGEAIVLSNSTTLFKNIILCLMLWYLWVNNTKVSCLFKTYSHWLVVIFSIAYCFIVILIGYNVQPLIDFRSYGIGKPLVSDDNVIVTNFEYEKDGKTQVFSSEALPDSTWTFVQRLETEELPEAGLTVFEDGEDVTSEVILSKGPQLIFFVSDVAAHNFARTHVLNQMADYMDAHDGSFIAVVALPDSSVDAWAEKMDANYDVFTAEDTSIKAVVRGDAAIVYLEDGKVVWKRNLYSLSPSFLSDADDIVDDVRNTKVVDDGTYFRNITLAYIICLLIIYLLNFLSPSKKKSLSETTVKSKSAETQVEQVTQTSA